MSRARQIADFGDGIATADIDDGAVTAAKIGSLPAGSVLQVVQTVKTDTFSTSLGPGSEVDITGLSVSITPSSASNKILIFVSVPVSIDDDGNAVRTAKLFLLRDSTNIATGASSGSRTINAFTSIGNSANEARVSQQHSFQYLDSPNTTSSVTYKIQGSVDGPSAVIYIGRSVSDLDDANHPRTVSVITAMEIAG